MWVSLQQYLNTWKQNGKLVVGRSLDSFKVNAGNSVYCCQKRTIRAMPNPPNHLLNDDLTGCDSKDQSTAVSGKNEERAIESWRKGHHHYEVVKPLSE